MDSLRIKHVVNEVAASLGEHKALPNFDQHARKTCEEVAILLLEDRAGYNRLNIAAANYQDLRTTAELIRIAVLSVASRWNGERMNSGDPET